MQIVKRGKKMSDKEKLDIACMKLRAAVKNRAVPSYDIKKKWVELSLTSTRKRNKNQFSGIRLQF